MRTRRRPAGKTLCAPSGFELAGWAYPKHSDMLINHKELTLQDAEVVTSALEHFRGHPRLGFSDCLVLEIARKAGHLPLGRFDRSLAKLNGTEQLK